MNISQINIDGFGVLADLQLKQLDAGLNVIYGSNGSGKTTVLQFLRGVLAGFDEARRLRLLPPLKGGSPGGGIELKYRAAQYEVIRRARPDQSDTLAINMTHGNHSDVAALRKEIEELDPELLKTVFFVGGFESHAVDAMVRLALRDGIALESVKQSADWLNDHLADVSRQRRSLFEPAPDRGDINNLHGQRNRVSEALKAAEQRQHEQQDRWFVELTNLRSRIAQLRAEADWLNTELQSAQADLTEINDRLWSQRRIINTIETLVEQHERAEIPDWIQEIREIDDEIAHAQAVLRDLAASRMKLSVAKANLTGSETPDDEAVFARHREAIAGIEDQVARLSRILVELDQAHEQHTCICQNLRGPVSDTLESIRKQISLLCQELSRQQSAHEQLLISSKREGVDRCELELIRQIQRLRLRRDELLHQQGNSLDERIKFCTKHETQFCQCEDHQRYLASLPEVMRTVKLEPQVVVHEETEWVSNARRTDPTDQQHLKKRIAELRRQWLHTTTELRSALRHLAELEQAPSEFAADQSVQRLKYDYAVIEQKIADAREQWQSLAVLETVLRRTQDHMHIEHVSQVIEDSSQLLNEMTDGRYPAFRFLSDRSELVAVSDSGQELPMHALSRGTLDQAALCFRMALWAEYQRRGIQLPLVLDDVLPDSDEERLESAAQTLIDFAQEHGQMIFFTCQEYLCNIFRAKEVTVRELPHSSRLPYSGNGFQKPAATQRLNVVAKAEPTVVEPQTTEAVRMYRAQPDQPFWLEVDSAVSLVPSIGEQMARRLGALGVQEVSDLIDLDPETTDVPLESLQISASTLREWQAEARLLCCVPDLTPRDARLLVALSIYNPSELAEADPDHLTQRLRSLRDRSRSDLSLSWMSSFTEWPDHDQVSRWIRRGRGARTYRRAREWSARRGNGRSRRRFDRSDFDSHRTYARSSNGTSRSSTSDRDGQPRHFTTFSAGQSRQATATQPRMLTAESTQVAEPAEEELRFYLSMSSPIVDAPSIGPKMAERLEKIGIKYVSDLINGDAALIAERLNRRRVKEDTVREWQQQSTLVCCIPFLRGHDAQVLVACDVIDPTIIANSTPEELFAIVGPFSNSNEGQRLLRSAKTPDLDEVTDWISFAKNARMLKAA